MSDYIEALFEDAGPARWYEDVIQKTDNFDDMARFLAWLFRAATPVCQQQGDHKRLLWMAGQVYPHRRKIHAPHRHALMAAV